MLTLAMMLSVMVMNTGAAFADQKDINSKHTEAVDMCVALSIINGYDNKDGTFSFKPNGDVTRAQMCKMICVAMNGGKEPVLGTSATSSFTDVPTTHWASKYIESCVTQGIVAGIGSGKFNPDGNVTGTQAAKMLLIALGYDADKEGLVGTTVWDVKTNVLATKSGLYEDLEDIDVSAALSREHAAQMIWNCLQAVEVEYDYSLTTDGNGNLTSTPKAKDKAMAYGESTIPAYALYDWYKYIDVNSGVTITDVTYDEDDAEFTVYMADDFDYDWPDSYNISEDTETDYSALFGHKLDAVYNTDGDLTGFVDRSTVLVSGVIDDIDNGTTGDNKIKVDGTQYKLDVADNAIPYIYFLEDGDYDDYDDMMAFWAFDLLDSDDNDKGDSIVVYPTYVGQVSYVGAKSITVGGIGSFTLEDNDIYDGVAEDDYVLVTLGTNTAYDNGEADENAIITKLDMATMTCGGVKSSGDVQLDGAWYTNEDINDTTFSAGDDFDVYMVNDVVVAAEATDDSSKDILFVSASDEFDSEWNDNYVTGEVEVYFLDSGDDATVITVNKIDGQKLYDGPKSNCYNMNSAPNSLFNADWELAPGLYTYTVSGGSYNLTPVSKDNKADFDDYFGFEYNVRVYGYQKDKGIGTNADATSFMKIADNAIIYTFDNRTNDVDVLSGKELKDSNDYGKISSCLVETVNGIDYVTVAYLYTDVGNVISTSSDMQFAYVIDDPYTTQIKDGEDDVKVTAIPVWNGEKTDVLYNEDGTASGLVKGNAFGYIVEDGLYANDVAKATMASIVGMEYEDEGDVMYYVEGSTTGHYNSTKNTVAMDEDIVFIGIDSDEYDNCASIGMNDVKQVKFQKDGSGNPVELAANSYVYVDGGKILAIFYDLSNQLVDEEGGDDIVWTNNYQ